MRRSIRLRGKLLPLVFLDRLLMRRGGHENTMRPATTSSPCWTPTAGVSGWWWTGWPIPKKSSSSRSSPVLKDIGLYSGATVLGNADLALILDPGAIALRAGIAIRGEEDASRAKQQEAGEDDGVRAEFLLVETAGRRAAVPAGRRGAHRADPGSARRVHRRTGRCSTSKDSWCPVEDTGGVPGRGQSCIPEARIIVVICREGNRHVGIAVSHVLDVAAGGVLFEAGTHQRSRRGDAA